MCFLFCLRHFSWFVVDAITSQGIIKRLVVFCQYEYSNAAKDVYFVWKTDGPCLHFKC